MTVICRYWLPVAWIGIALMMMRSSQVFACTANGESCTSGLECCNLICTLSVCVDPFASSSSAASSANSSANSSADSSANSSAASSANSSANSAQCTSGACCDTLTNTFRLSSFECRAAAGVCDVAETCDGSGANCPTDVFETAGVHCTATSCCAGSSDTCNEVSCIHTPIKGGGPGGPGVGPGTGPGPHSANASAFVFGIPSSSPGGCGSGGWFSFSWLFGGSWTVCPSSSSSSSTSNPSLSSSSHSSSSVSSEALYVCCQEPPTVDAFTTSSQCGGYILLQATSLTECRPLNVAINRRGTDDPEDDCVQIVAMDCSAIDLEDWECVPSMADAALLMQNPSPPTCPPVQTTIAPSGTAASASPVYYDD